MAAVYAKRPGTPIATRIAAWPWAAMARHTLHLLVLGGMVWMLVLGWRALHDPWNFPLRVVKVDGELQHLKPQAVQTAVDARLQGSFFGVDLPNVLRGLTDLAWIKDARVRREWPDKLHLWVEEHKPLALWRGDAVLTADGSLIYPEGKREDDRRLDPLPALSGSDGREMALWNELNRLSALLAPMGLRVVALREDQRGSQTLLLEHGLSLRLGRENVEERLQRFLAVFPKTLAGRIDAVEEVDLRYAHGFSVRMRAPKGGEALSKIKENMTNVFAPSPLTGEGWGEGGDAGRVSAWYAVATPSPARGEGVKKRLEMLGHLISVPSVFSVATMDFKTYTRHRGDSTLVATISTVLTGKEHGQKVG